jgi:hypothetical protein
MKTFKLIIRIMSFSSESDRNIANFLDSNRIASCIGSRSSTISQTNNSLSDFTKLGNDLFSSNSSPIDWERNNCYQLNDYNYTTESIQMDICVQSTNYSDPALACNTDISSEYDCSSANNNQMVFFPNSVSQQNYCITQTLLAKQSESENIINNNANKAMNSTDYCEETMKIQLRVPSKANQTSDCIQTHLNISSFNLENIQFKKTIEFLRATNLLHLTLQTADLMKKNYEIQKEINNLKKYLSRFVSTN